MKRILFGLLVAGVALSASAFNPSTSYTFYNTNAGSLNSLDPIDYVYLVSASCDGAEHNCSITFNADELDILPTAGSTTLNVAKTSIITINPALVSKGEYQQPE